MNGPLRSEDDDPRPEQMTQDPGRYFGDAWERSREAVLAGSGGQRKPATLAPGIVEMSLRGDPADVEWILNILSRGGAKAWRANSTGTRDGNRAGYEYFSVQVPKDSRG